MSPRRSIGGCLLLGLVAEAAFEICEGAFEVSLAGCYCEVAAAAFDDATDVVGGAP